MNNKYISKAIAVCMTAIFISNLSVPMVLANEPAPSDRWIKNGSALSWIQEDGSFMIDNVTPDGYYVDYNGFWKTENISLLNEKFSVPDQFVSSTEMITMKLQLAEINKINKQVQALFKGNRVIKVSDDSISYSMVDKKKHIVLFALHRDVASDGWKLKISCSLDCSRTDKLYATNIDFMVFQFLLSRISHTPLYVSDAIYCSWEGNNNWGLSCTEETAVGDTMIKYTYEDGAAIYHLTERK